MAPGRSRPDQVTAPEPRPDQHDHEVDPRFLLANERTFLAWGRTSLALVAAGVAVSQLLDQFGLPGGRQLLGVPLILLGGLIAWLSHRRSNQIEQALRHGLTLPSHRLPTILTATIITAAVLSVLLAVGSGSGGSAS